jgi:hypothetical protein
MLCAFARTRIIVDATNDPAACPLNVSLRREYSNPLIEPAHHGAVFLARNISEYITGTTPNVSTVPSAAPNEMTIAML